jgi:hypothetical protein
MSCRTAMRHLARLTYFGNILRCVPTHELCEITGQARNDIDNVIIKKPRGSCTPVRASGAQLLQSSRAPALVILPCPMCFSIGIGKELEDRSNIR